MSATGKRYLVKLDFTTDKQQDLLEKVWPESVGKRVIKAELGMDPCTDNGSGDVRYETDDPEAFVGLLKIAAQHSAGGWWSADPMPEGGTGVVHLPMRGGKYSNCPDYVKKKEGEA